MIRVYLFLYFLLSCFRLFPQKPCSDNFEKKYDFKVNKYRVHEVNDTIPYKGMIKIPITEQNIFYFTTYNEGLKDGIEYSEDSLGNIQHRDIFQKNELIKSTHYFYENNEIVDSTYVKPSGFSFVDKLFLESLEENLESKRLNLDFMFWDFKKEKESTIQLKKFIDTFGNIKEVDFTGLQILYNSYNDTNYYDLKMSMFFDDYILKTTFNFLYLKSEAKRFSQLFEINSIKSKSDSIYFKSYIRKYVEENLKNNSLSKYFIENDQFCGLEKVSNIFSYQDDFSIIYKLQSKCYDKNTIISIKLPLRSVIEKDLNVESEISTSDYRFYIDGCKFEK